MQNEGRIQRRLRPALAFVSQEVKFLFPPDRTANVAAKLVEAKCIETRRGEQIVRIQLVIAEEFINRAVNIIAPGLRDRVYDGTEIAPVVGGIGTAATRNSRTQSCDGLARCTPEMLVV